MDITITIPGLVVVLTAIGVALSYAIAGRQR